MPEWVNTGDIKWTIDSNGDVVANYAGPDSGITPLGNYIRLPGGLQLCSQQITLEYFSVDLLRGFATFPKPFVTAIYTTFSIRGTLATPLRERIGAEMVVPVSGTQVDLRIYRLPGAAPFEVADTVNVIALSMGVWQV